MKFLALMLLLLTGRFRRRPDWASDLAGQLTPHQTRTSAWWGIFILLGAIEYGLLQFAAWEHGLLSLMIQLGVLYIFLPHWYPYDLTGRYADLWRSGDAEAAYRDACGALQLESVAVSQDLRRIHYRVCKRYIAASFQRFFVLLFWFICLGLPGLFLGVWCVQRVQSQAPTEQSMLSKLLLWLPSRALGYSFFIVGNGLGAYEQLKAHGNRDTSTARWLFHMALGAVGEDSHQQYANPRLISEEEFRLHAVDELGSMTVLIRRAAVLWLVVFGVLTMLGIESPLL